MLRQHPSPTAESPAAQLPTEVRHLWPAWALSLVLHASLLATLGALARFGPQNGPEEELREAGIVLVQQSDGQREYIEAPTGDQPDRTARPAENVLQALPNLNDAPPLPNQPSGVTQPQSASTQSPAAQPALPGRTSGSSDGAEGVAGGDQSSGTTRLSVFGLTGEGKTFVFVFDRSGSMAGYGGAPLRAAKSELVRGIEQLDPIHQFQIIFYNERPLVFRPDSGEPRLVSGDEVGKQLARKFIDEVTANGGTQHLDALKLALNMAPDVIFFLTDADEPRLSDADLRRIRGWNRHSVIHAIEFGHGRPSDRQNFLVRLAEQNGGQHAYVDVSRLPAEHAEK
ncbi:MAG: VWA domain-containing protein [Pirellulales bacterium]